MNLHEAIEQLEKIVRDVRQAVSIDDLTPLRNALALRDEAILIDSGKSTFDVVIFGDLNRFKGLNDLHGHDAGNLAIHEVGEKLRGIIANKMHASAYRQSGDEFVILLNHESLNEFLVEAAAFTEVLFSHNGKPLKTAMSFGYAINDGKTSFSDLLGRAELACQNAKDKGDGSCVGWSEELQRTPLKNLRGRCQQCGARINCNVPANSAPAKLISCPCCNAAL